MIMIDAHCHLANLAQLLAVDTLINEAGEREIGAFASSALTTKEVSWHLENPYPNIVFSAGIHPNFDLCDLDLNRIDELADTGKIWAIGEIGMDRNNPDLAWQRQLFRQQLELAAVYKLPVVLHLVGHQQEAMEMLSRYPLLYLIHGYAGSVEAYRNLAELNSWFTISSRILKEDKHQLLDAMLQDERYFFETDITQYYVHENEQNPLLRLIDVINSTSTLSGINRTELISTQADNAHQLGMGKP